MFVFEGDVEAEKKLDQGYLRAKYFHIADMLEKQLKRTDIDGSGRITVVAAKSPYETQYYHSDYFHISAYYLDPEQIDRITSATTEAGEPIVLEALINALLDIAKRNDRDEEVIQKIIDAGNFVREHNYTYSERIAKLSKKSQQYGVTANVYRTFSKEVAEGWYVSLVNSAKEEIYSENMCGIPSPLDRYNNCYRKAAWEGQKFVLYDNFDEEFYSLDISDIPPFTFSNGAAKEYDAQNISTDVPMTPETEEKWTLKLGELGDVLTLLPKENMIKRIQGDCWGSFGVLHGQRHGLIKLTDQRILFRASGPATIPRLVFAIPYADIISLEAFSVTSFLHTGIRIVSQQEGGFRISMMEPERKKIMNIILEYVRREHG